MDFGRQFWIFARGLLAGLACTGLSVTFSVPLVAQSGLPATLAPLKTHDGRVSALIDALNRTRVPENAAISPDGTYVAWTLGGRSGGDLHVTGLAPEGTAQDGAWDRVISPDTISNVTNGKPGICSGSRPVWSPDGKQLAFLSACAQQGGSWRADEQNEIFVWTLAGNSLKQVTQVVGTIDQMAWSPDGKAIAFLFVENATRSAGALAAMKPWSGVIGEDGVEIQRVYGVNVGDGTGDFLTPSNLHVYEFDWSPNSQQLAFIAANPPGENNWWVA